MPSATAEQRNERRRALAALLREHAVERQSELVVLLRQQGFAATQSSVSRDLKDMGAVKLKKGYSLPEEEPAGNGDALSEIAEFVREIRAAGANLVVVTTAIGAA
jgi:transcriptional regulator of arginine metabolism